MDGSIAAWATLKFATIPPSKECLHGYLVKYICAVLNIGWEAPDPGNVSLSTWALCQAPGPLPSENPTMRLHCDSLVLSALRTVLYALDVRKRESKPD
jgi:hypothetical protein